MLERVALATCASIPCICKNRLGFEGMPCLDRARMALIAMREPTEAMQLAGEQALETWQTKTVGGVYRAMIDAALKE